MTAKGCELQTSFNLEQLLRTVNTINRLDHFITPILERRLKTHYRNRKEVFIFWCKRSDNFDNICQKTVQTYDDHKVSQCPHKR